jgi:hypothetical protein
MVDGQPESTRQIVHSIHHSGITSPFAAAFSVPLSTDPIDYGNVEQLQQQMYFPDNWGIVAGYVAFSLVLNLGLFLSLIWLLGSRWRVSQ